MKTEKELYYIERLEYLRSNEIQSKEEQEDYLLLLKTLLNEDHEELPFPLTFSILYYLVINYKQSFFEGYTY